MSGINRTKREEEHSEGRQHRLGGRMAATRDRAQEHQCSQRTRESKRTGTEVELVPTGELEAAVEAHARGGGRLA